MTDPCARDPGRIDALRDWAWERGRTDIVLDLDLHASAWAFQDNPTQPNLARLSALLPRDHPDGGLAATLRQAAFTGCRAGDLDCLQQALQAWCPHLCTRVLADLQEMAADRPQVTDSVGLLGAGTRGDRPGWPAARQLTAGTLPPGNRITQRADGRSSGPANHWRTT